MRKHGIDFADAIAVLEDDLALTVLEESSNEDRFVTIGMDTLGRLLLPHRRAGSNHLGA